MKELLERIEKDFEYLEEEDYYFETTINGKSHVLSGTMRLGLLMFLNYDIDNEDQEMTYEFKKFMTYTCHDAHLEYLDKEAEKEFENSKETNNDYLNREFYANCM